MTDDAFLNQLREEAQKLGDKIGKIESAKVRAVNGPIVGKTFKRDNSYSGSKRWMQYAKAVRMDKYGMLFAATFEVDCDGRVSSDPDNCIYHAQYYTRIPAAEYERAKRKFIARAKSIP